MNARSGFYHGHCYGRAPPLIAIVILVAQTPLVRLLGIAD
jgi:hypothetical protein